MICVPPTAGRLRRCRRPLNPAFPVSKLATGNGTVTLSPVESAIASVAPAAPSSPPNGSAGRKLRPAPPSHCVACGVALTTLVSAPPPGRPTITVTELASAFVDTHSAGPAAVSMRTSRIAAEAVAGNVPSAVASTASRGSRRRILSTYDMAECVPARTIRPMQRAVAIALAGGLLAASAGAFALAQLLKLERSPIEAIRVDPTANHGRGLLDRHDSALFSPHCSAPCLRSAQVRFRVHTSGPVTAEVVAPGGTVVRDLGRLPHRGGRVVAVLGRPRRRWRRRPGRLLPVAGRSVGAAHPAAQSAHARHGGRNPRHERLAARDLARLRQPRRSRHGRGAGPRAARRPAAAGAARRAPRPHGAPEEPRSLTRDQLAAPCGQALRDGARRPVPPARDRARRCRQRARHRRRRRACTRGRPVAARRVDRGRTPDPCRHLGRCARDCVSTSRGSGERPRCSLGAPTRPRPSHACRRRRAAGCTTSAIVTPVVRRAALLAVRGARPAHVALVVSGQPRADPRRVSAAPRWAGSPLRRAHTA